MSNQIFKLPLTKLLTFRCMVSSMRSLKSRIGFGRLTIGFGPLKSSDSVAKSYAAITISLLGTWFTGNRPTGNLSTRQYPLHPVSQHVVDSWFAKRDVDFVAAVRVFVFDRNVPRAAVASLVQAGGLVAISRWLSAAIPPDTLER